MVDVDKEDRSSELEKKEQVTVVGPEAPSLEDSPPEESSQEYVPDGGREAWTVVLGTSLALFSSAGMINAYVGAFFPFSSLEVVPDESTYEQGTFQSYYETTLLPSSSSSSISLIGSLQVFLLYFVGTFAGRAFDAYGSSVSTLLPRTPTQF